jgi:hypothetical protein
MPFDGATIRVADISALDTMAPPRVDFHRPERLAVLGGSLAIGGGAGFSLAMMLGPMNIWTIVAVAAPVLALALHFTQWTLRDAISRGAYGCAAAASMHAAALLAWPFAGLMMPLAPTGFWIAPALAVGTLVLSASCWGGAPRTVYRLAAQGILVAALAAHQGTILFMGA